MAKELDPIIEKAEDAQNNASGRSASDRRAALTDASQAYENVLAKRHYSDALVGYRETAQSYLRYWRSWIDPLADLEVLECRLERAQSM